MCTRLALCVHGPIGFDAHTRNLLRSTRVVQLSRKNKHVHESRQLRGSTKAAATAVDDAELVNNTRRTQRCRLTAHARDKGLAHTIEFMDQQGRATAEEVSSVIAMDG